MPSGALKDHQYSDHVTYRSCQKTLHPDNVMTVIHGYQRASKSIPDKCRFNYYLYCFSSYQFNEMIIMTTQIYTINSELFFVFALENSF